MKKINIIMLCLLIIVSMTSNAFAIQMSDSFSDNKIITTIEYDEVLSKASGILEAANFSNNYSNLNSSGNYYLGSEILLYEVKDKIQSMNDIKYYPVFLENDIIGVVIARLSSDNEVLLEYIDYLAEELNLIYNLNKETCIVFDKNYAWLYSGQDRKNISLDKGPLQRGEITVSFDISNEINKTFIKKKQRINFDGSNSLRGNVTTGSKTLNVPVKTQILNSEYCWACVASSIGQFKKGTVIDPQTLAYEYAGDLYTPKTISTIKNILSAEYNLSSTTRNYSLLMSVVQSNIKANNPIATRVRYSLTSGHFIVVNGYSVGTVSSSATYYVYIMDSLYANGFRTMQLSSVAIDKEVKYYSVSSGTEYNTTNYLELS